MPHQNRVTPISTLIATPERGTLMGNRGCLHNARREIVRDFVGKRWIACRLEFRGRRRAVMTPGRYTELFFLDEATALAAGHRPCAECRREEYNAFRRAWVDAGLPSRGALPRVDEMDARLHAERLDSRNSKIIHPAQLADLPDAAFVLDGDGAARLLQGGHLWLWTPGGYTAPIRASVDEQCRLLTPPSIVAALRAGYQPDYHPSLS